ncbi:ribonuclease D [Sinimarinibacterium sp. NLF-5-8]|uniref:ribonuclease D n=1 Tax=Sinimarinibacterium sp. NLF-5-8 TaxID=2698684 RepID=UPI00137C328C|nr:ribonuclease D [Sinimarinibacterium sp. NLF-5-8]QHS10111.1 ribonuclease D [Sinimarinibacterium sp. NLF-5-8]
MPHTLITDTDALARAAERWASSPFLALDTEFVRIDTYYPRLCLIQVRDHQRTDLLDMTAIADIKPLLDALDAPAQIKLFHAASQDLEILTQLHGSAPKPLFDTQIAATLLGVGDQVGYGKLVQQQLNITLDKSLSRTDWARRPLRQDELAYAADDVEYLAQIYPALQAELAARGRLEWLAEDCARMAEPSQYHTDPADAWQRLRGLGRMSAREQTVAAALAQWRETLAQTHNRPRKWILDDDAIYRLAERQPHTLKALELLQVVPSKTQLKHGEALLDIIREAQNQPETRWAADDELSDSDKSQLKKLQAIVADRARALELPPGFIAPRADLIRIVHHQANARVLSGWRRTQCGEALLAAL